MDGILLLFLDLQLLLYIKLLSYFDFVVFEHEKKIIKGLSAFQLFLFLRIKHFYLLTITVKVLKKEVNDTILICIKKERERERHSGVFVWAFEQNFFCYYFGPQNSMTGAYVYFVVDLIGYIWKLNQWFEICNLKTVEEVSCFQKVNRSAIISMRRKLLKLDRILN